MQEQSDGLQLTEQTTGCTMLQWSVLLGKITAVNAGNGNFMVYRQNKGLPFPPKTLPPIFVLPFTAEKLPANYVLPLQLPPNFVLPFTAEKLPHNFVLPFTAEKLPHYFV